MYCNPWDLFVTFFCVEYFSNLFHVYEGLRNWCIVTGRPMCNRDAFKFSQAVLTKCRKSALLSNLIRWPPINPTTKLDACRYYIVELCSDVLHKVLLFRTTVVQVEQQFWKDWPTAQKQINIYEHDQETVKNKMENANSDVWGDAL